MKLPPTVFIVDDRFTVLNDLKVILQAYGHSVRCIGSASEFIAEQDPNQAGCVLIDPLMDTSGSTVLRWLHESGSLLSIVLVSGLIDAADFIRDSNAPRIAKKPYEVSALLTMVADGIAGSLSRKVVRDRSRLRG